METGFEKYMHDLDFIRKWVCSRIALISRGVVFMGSFLLRAFCDISSELSEYVASSGSLRPSLLIIFSQSSLEASSLPSPSCLTHSQKVRKVASLSTPSRTSAHTTPARSANGGGASRRALRTSSCPVRKRFLFVPDGLDVGTPGARRLRLH